VSNVGWSRRLGVGVTYAVMAFLLTPLVVIVLASFTSGESITFPPRGLSGRWYGEILANPKWYQATLTSVQVALLASAIATVCGAGLAVGARRLSPRVSSWLSVAAVAPVVMPLVVLAVGLFFSLARLSLVDRPAGLAIAHAILGLPIVYLVVSASLHQFDNELLEAAACCGATRRYAYATVLFPYLRPAVLVAAFLAFTTSFDEIVIASFLGLGDTVTLPNLIWRSLSIEPTPVVTAISALTIGGGLGLQILVLVLVARRFRRKGAGRPAARALT
jgi:putative spermidine/putrescine transport system permease protein